MIEETEIRCERCAREHHGRRPTLLATVRGREVLQPVRLDRFAARRLGLPRAGLFWRRPAVNQDGRYVLRCRRCKTVRLLAVE